MSDFFMFDAAENAYFRKSHVVSIGSRPSPRIQDDVQPRYRAYITFIDGRIVQKEFLGENARRDSARFVLEKLKIIEGNSGVSRYFVLSRNSS